MISGSQRVHAQYILPRMVATSPVYSDNIPNCLFMIVQQADAF